MFLVVLAGLWGASWGRLGAYWERLGSSWGRLGGLQGRLGRVLGSNSDQNRPKNDPKSIKKRSQIDRTRKPEDKTGQV